MRHHNILGVEGSLHDRDVTYGAAVIWRDDDILTNSLSRISCSVAELPYLVRGCGISQLARPVVLTEAEAKMPLVVFVVRRDYEHAFRFYVSDDFTADRASVVAVDYGEDFYVAVFRDMETFRSAQQKTIQKVLSWAEQHFADQRTAEASDALWRLITNALTLKHDDPRLLAWKAYAQSVGALRSARVRLRNDADRLVFDELFQQLQQ